MPTPETDLGDDLFAEGTITVEKLEAEFGLK